MRDNSAAAIALALVGVALLTGMDALVKSLLVHFTTFQIVLLRFVFTALWVGVLVVIQRPRFPRRGRLPGHAGRAALTVVTTCSFFYALGKLPLAETFALSFTSPIFIVVFGALFLSEPLRWPILIAIGAGFSGMLVIVFGGHSTPSGQELNLLAVAAALLSPVTYALSIVLLRAQTAHEPASVIVLVQAILISLFIAPLAAADFQLPRAEMLAQFALVGLLSAAGYLAFAHALSRTTAARFSVVEYTGLLWAALLGYVFFAEAPRLELWIGAALIIGGCLLVLRQRAAAQSPAPP
ncbi:MAG: DMT family transporter [Proteobacteria bacterium]|nr:DMT family transporter [Pseudomonadota bacterium]